MGLRTGYIIKAPTRFIHGFYPSIFLFSQILLFVFHPVQAQYVVADSVIRSSYPASSLFGGDDLLDLTLTTDLKTLVLDINDSATYHPAMVGYRDPGGNEQKIPVKVQTRGQFRKDRSICNFPPLKLHIKKEDARNTLFEDCEKTKLTTHCKSNNASFDQYYLIEYLIYRMYNLLTDYSFQVRLARITYIDSEGRVKPDTWLGFFIEDNDMLARRTHCKVVRPYRMEQRYANQPHMDLFTVFQYMIGNTDWSVYAGHNCEYLQPEEGSAIIVVPYDFDFSGAVEAPYATTDPKLPIKTVRQRLYRGNCKTQAELQPVFDRFNARKADIYRLYQDCPYLKENSKRSLVAYYDKFYHIVNNRKQVEREFHFDCTER